MSFVHCMCVYLIKDKTKEVKSSLKKIIKIGSSKVLIPKQKK